MNSTASKEQVESKLKKQEQHQKTGKVLIRIFKLDQKVQTPRYESSGSAGFDIRAFFEDGQSYTLKAGDRARIPTGLKVILPEGYELQIRPRSGLAFKYGVTLTNSPGTIDSDYRGELQVLIVNHGQDDFVINNGDRIAQAVVAPIYIADFEEIDEMPDESNNSRREGGFGSTGLN